MTFMENTTFLELVSFIVLFVIIPLQIIVAIVELLVYFIFRLLSPDKIITYEVPSEISSKDARVLKIGTSLLFALSICTALSIYKSYLIAVPFLVSGIILYANWRLAYRIYILYKYSTEKVGTKQVSSQTTE